MAFRSGAAHGAGAPPADETDPPVEVEPLEGDEDSPGTPDDVPEQPAADEPGTPAVPPAVVPKWVQLVLLPLALVGLFELARASGSVLLIAVFASVVALILNPIVQWLHRRRLRRGFAILLIYLSGFALLGGIGVALVSVVSNQVSTFQKDVPHLTKQANKELASVQRWLDRNGIKVQIQKQGQTALQTVEKNILKRSGDIVSFSRDLLQKLVTIGFALVIVLVLSIYMLVYGPDIGRIVRRIVPPGDGTPDDDFPTLIQRAVSGYVRGQLTFSLIMGASAALALEIFGLTGIFKDGSRYALFFGAFYGLMELIPYIGPIIGPIPAIVVALFDHPLTALWVLILFIALQQLEGHVVAPQVFRLSLRINPILIILSLLVGDQIYGIAGALLALPVAAIVRETIMYMRRHLVLEPWTVSTPGTGVADQSSPPGRSSQPDPGPDAP